MAMRRHCLLSFVLLSTLGACGAPSNNTSTAQVSGTRQAPPVTANTSEQADQGTLEAAANELFLLIETGEPQQLVSWFSEEGVVLGIHSPRVSIADLRRELEERTGIFCVFFDTECARREDVAVRGAAGAPPLANLY